MPRLRVVFMGTPELAVPTLAALHEAHDVVTVVTQPDRRRGRGRQPGFSPVKEFAVANDLAVLQPPSFREDAAVAALASCAADAFVVVAFGLLLPATVLSLPRLGCVNLHASVLPRHRGASPIQAALLAGDAATGATTMLMDEGLDTGPVLRVQEIAIRAHDTAATLGARLAAAGAPLVLETLAGLDDGTITPQPQPQEGVTMTRKIRKEDGRIDWSLPAARIERQVRAMQPWPSAFTSLSGQRLQVWAAEIGEPTAAAPGTVVVTADRLEIACGDGTGLVLVELQRAGGRRLAALEFLRGMAIPVGARLGDVA